MASCSSSNESFGDAMKIGYQGAIGSNSDQAAHNMARDLCFKNVEYVPLVSSKRVISALNRGDIDYGVVAIKNTIGGRVQETFDAIRDEQLELVRTEILEIHHCLYKFPGTPLSEIKYVASHIQALKQTETNRGKRYPDLEPMEIEDTAIGAKWLASGKLDKNVAVLCRDTAGELYDLELVEANLEDTHDNLTEFRMFKLPPIDYDDEEKPTIQDRLIYSMITQTGIGNLAKAIVILGLFSAVYFAGEDFLTSVDLAVALSGAISALFLYLTSSRTRNYIRFRALKGYWKYYSVPDKGRESSLDQLYEVPRVVLIDDIGNELYLKGWICDKAAIPFFEANKSIVSSSEQAHGSLVYWYHDPQEVGRGVTLNGFVELNWVKRNPCTKINKMSGRYSGKATGETGTLIFYRISKDEFMVHKQCDFLGKVTSSA